MRDILNLIKEDVATDGELPAKDLAVLLPDVSDVNHFSSALMKIENGQTDLLSIQEKGQLANAFISLIRLPGPKKTLVIQKMMPVSQPQQKNN